MDFGLDETQEALRDLAAGLLAKEASQERLEAHERGGAPYDERLWQALRESGLTAICVPEHAGGAGLGPVEMAVVLREAGARAAPGPLAATLVSTLAASRYGTPEQKRLTGAAVSTVAIREPGRALADPPATTAERKAGGWALTGRKCGVAYPDGDLLVTADEGLFLVHAAVPASGSASAAEATAPASGIAPAAEAAVVAVSEFASTGEVVATVTFDAAPAERVAGPEAVAGVRHLYTAATAAQASGVLAGALRLTTEHVRNRKQFGRALAEFQAVTTQVADVYIAARALDVAMWSGAWRLAEGLPAEEDLALAAYHTSEAARALYTCQHLHGGLGLDVTYPLHRYFAHAKHLAHLLGGADAQLDLIGALA
ncbi:MULTISPECIES: acyl-CoA dehydrogenase family protein [Nonomuraea]|uniref:Acyl-CoA/acyl-ACP dehydrogenase n=1 Tax=Nonomuraea ferruginea TaxID=46174 RepID=A0ABT4SZP9_9ACTN|nr:acyl-CoA dehydrogenase family protein [Nonomuraea ferruginea]MDA0642743.1 acyl-CoA/acyl-ACP dehydrogenase [Nonomuraea ferruginea]